MRDKFKDFIIWGFFSVFIALIPIMFSWCIFFFSMGTTKGIEDLLVGGELFLVSTGVSGEALGRVVLGLIRDENSDDDVRQFLTMMACFSVMLLSVLMFASVFVSSINTPTEFVGSPTYLSNIRLVSYVVLGAAIVTGSVAIFVTPILVRPSQENNYPELPLPLG